MTPEQDKLQQRMRPLVLATVSGESQYEMAKAFLRYQKFKSLLPKQRLDMVHQEHWCGESFDDQLDELILTDA